MKTYKNLFEKVCSFENLHLAYLKARKCKRYRNEILKFSYNLEANLLELRRELLDQSYQHGGYREFIVCDAKKRRIKAAPFRDRVVHHALCNIIELIFDKSFIYDTYACRRGKGTHKALKRLEKFLKSADKLYVLQCDISKYFDSIDHKILFGLLKKKIADRKVLALIGKIIESNQESPGKGIPIGNLTSQLFANVYLSELDKFAKHQLAARHYLRYMDDFLVLECVKKKLHRIKEEMRTFLKEKLELDFHPKKANIFPTGKGIDFLGYRIFSNYRLLRKDTVKRFVKRTKMYQNKLNRGLMTWTKFNNALFSWLAYARLGNSWQLIRILAVC